MTCLNYSCIKVKCIYLGGLWDVVLFERKKLISLPCALFRSLLIIFKVKAMIFKRSVSRWVLYLWIIRKRWWFRKPWQPVLFSACLGLLLEEKADPICIYRVIGNSKIFYFGIQNVGFSILFNNNLMEFGGALGNVPQKLKKKTGYKNSIYFELIVHFQENYYKLLSVYGKLYSWNRTNSPKYRRRVSLDGFTK
jgi:hypothetical protein